MEMLSIFFGRWLADGSFLHSCTVRGITNTALCLPSASRGLDDREWRLAVGTP